MIKPNQDFLFVTLLVYGLISRYLFIVDYSTNITSSTGLTVQLIKVGRDSYSS